MSNICNLKVPTVFLQVVFFTNAIVAMKICQRLQNCNSFENYHFQKYCFTISISRLAFQHLKIRQASTKNHLIVWKCVADFRIQ